MPWQTKSQERRKVCYNLDMLLVKQVKLKLEEDEKVLATKLRKRLGLKKDENLTFKIDRKSLDLRDEAKISYNLLVDVKNENKYLRLKDVEKYTPFKLDITKKDRPFRPVIIGYGPSGIFANYLLLKAGYKPIVIERGSAIKKREKDVENFFKTGLLNEESNVQFGEGGAGTFSDAKLTTRIKDPLIKFITEVFIKYGASENIRYDHHPHVGTDVIRKVIQNMTEDMINNGSTILFDEKVSDLLISDGKIEGVISDKNTYYSPLVILASGHSGIEIYHMLKKHGVYLENKDFAIGFRVEHRQEFIDHNQYKEYYDLLSNNPSEYFLRAKTSLNKGVYSFCMCPGGEVINATFKKGHLFTNGMSYHDRASKVANSAILIQVSKEDYGDELFGGLEFIDHYERKAFGIDGTYKALAQNIKDYLNDELNPLIFESTYKMKTKLYNFNDFFAPNLNKGFHEALRHFDHLMPGFIEKGIMVGPETRSSAPLRIKRDTSFQSVNTKGLYPIGEGAGYGGGIMSCALDALRAALKIIEVSS